MGTPLGLTHKMLWTVVLALLIASCSGAALTEQHRPQQLSPAAIRRATRSSLAFSVAEENADKTDRRRRDEKPAVVFGVAYTPRESELTAIADERSVIRRATMASLAGYSGNCPGSEC